MLCGCGQVLLACMDKLYISYDKFESCAREFITVSSKLGDGWEERRAQVPSNPERETVFLVKRLSMLINDCHCDLQDQGENDHTSLEQLENGEGLRVLEEEDDPSIISSPGNTSQHSSSSPDIKVSSRSAVAESSNSPLLSVHVDYHIVHSFSYEVPILYFTATYSNGRQLSLNDTWKLLSDRFVSGDMDRWGLVSQQEHPLLHCPFYHIHPCHTAKVMAQARKTQIQTGSSEEEKISIERETEGEGGGEKRESQDLPNDVAVACSGGDDRTSGIKELGENLKLNGSGLKREPNYLLTWLSTFGPLVGLKVPLEYATIDY